MKKSVSQAETCSIFADVVRDSVLHACDAGAHLMQIWDNILSEIVHLRAVRNSDINPTALIIFWPVLKHGPRSLKYVQVNDSCDPGVKKVIVYMTASTAKNSSVHCLSMSTCFRTRKMVNYAWGEKGQGKLWWKLAALLTCKSFVTLGYRGERPMEPSSSWFPLKFPSG